MSGSPHRQTKLRVYDEAIEFRGNYKTVIFIEQALRQVIGEDLEEGPLPGPFPKTQLLGGFRNVHFNALWAETKESGMSSVRALVEAKQWGVNQNNAIH